MFLSGMRFLGQSQAKQNKVNLDEQRHCDLPYIFFRNRDEPLHCTTPLAMMAMRSPSRSASSMKCVVSRMVRPVLSCCSMSQMSRRAPGSMPEVGSSRNTTRLPPHNAMPTDSLRFIPPDKVRAFGLRNVLALPLLPSMYLIGGTY